MKGKWIGLMGLAAAAALGYAWAGERPQMRLDRYEIALLPGGVGAVTPYILALHTAKAAQKLQKM